MDYVRSNHGKYFLQSNHTFAFFIKSYKKLQYENMKWSMLSTYVFHNCNVSTAICLMVNSIHIFYLILQIWLNVWRAGLVHSTMGMYESWNAYTCKISNMALKANRLSTKSNAHNVLQWSRYVTDRIFRDFLCMPFMNVPSSA